MITMQDVIGVDNPEQYKLHLACSNGEVHPLDVFVADHNEWLGWNKWKNKKKDDWTREFVFSLIEFYPRNDSWLFGGVFRVIDRYEDRYELEEVDDYEKFVGRVILSFHRYQGMRGRAYRLEPYIDHFEVAEILPSVYSGERFPGFENISHDFHILEAIFRSERPDWMAALSNIKGVYVISDRENGRQYVGSAYGNMGIWARWACYMGTGHGWNDELTELINENGIEYARENFHFSIVEIMLMTTADEEVMERESFWKGVFLSREHGYNRN